MPPATRPLKIAGVHQAHVGARRRRDLNNITGLAVAQVVVNELHSVSIMNARCDGTDLGSLVSSSDAPRMMNRLFLVAELTVVATADQGLCRGQGRLLIVAGYRSQ